MFLDAALGILNAIFVSKYFHIELTWYFVVAGIIFTLLPDIDSLLFFLGRGKIFSKQAHFHRDILHLPLIYIPAGTIIFSIFGPRWGLLFAVGALLHFIHDSTFLGLGWGIKWLYPFSQNYFMAFRIRVGNEKKFPLKPFLNLTPAESKEMGNEYGDPDWLKICI